MNLLSHTTRLYRHNVTHIRLSLVCPTAVIRCLSSTQWKKYLTALDVDKDSTTKDIKDSFLKLSKVYHPDNKVTGSHQKFVELKEAYDALKDGHPKITNANTNRYNNYYDTDVTYQAHRDYRDRYKDYTYGQSNHGFGGPYGRSSTPWEDLRRDQAYRRQQDGSTTPLRGRGPVSITLILSAMAWIVIYSSFLLIWDYNSTVKKDLLENDRYKYYDYMQYQDYLQRKAAARVLRQNIIQNSKYTVEEEEDPKSYIMSNNERNLKQPNMVDSQSPSPSVSSVHITEPSLTELKSGDSEVKVDSVETL